MRPGGTTPSAERKALRSGATIVVGTPGRLRDHLERGALDLSALKAVTLDEADEMLDMGFREELETILDATPEGRRTLLFSATMPKPIEALARRYQNNALRISTVSADRGHGDISYEAVVVSPPEVENAVVNLLRYHEAETAILFCGTREKVRHMHATLQERGFAVVSLSGENSQSERNQALQALRRPDKMLDEMLRVAEEGIITFPNFAYWRHRIHLGLRGYMPVSKSLPHAWYDTPNIHLSTFNDFEHLCKEKGLVIVDRAVGVGDHKGHWTSKWWPNLFGEIAIFRVRRRA